MTRNEKQIIKAFEKELVNLFRITEKVDKLQEEIENLYGNLDPMVDMLAELFEDKESK
jgi:tetrahydromethanopterin S-methyltransferase subunit B